MSAARPEKTRAALHFEHDPREVPASEVALLEQLAPVLARAVAVDVF